MKHLMTHPAFQRVAKGLVVLAGLAVGIVLLLVFVRNRETPERRDSEVEPPAVTVIEARLLEFVLEARGHGLARPAETWQAVANVPGTVVERHPDLQSGALLREGTTLLVLDSSRYELSIAEARAEIARLEAERRQLDHEANNTRRLLAIERERLGLAERELVRIENLAETGAVSSSRLDEQRRATLAQRQAVASLENELDLLPSRGEVLEAQWERARVRLEQARRDLEDTRFVAPYDLRLGEVTVELHQFVGAGQRLFEADSLSAAEVEARIPISAMRRLLGAVAPARIPEGALDIDERIDLSAITAELELVGTTGVTWEGRVTRIASGLDPVTRAVRAVVRVERPYDDALPPERPPLQRDMYTRVRLSAPSPEPLLAVPSTALHHGELYLVDSANRLVRRPVQVAFEQGDLTVIKEGLHPGELVVVDDLPVALAGMPLSPTRDEALEERMAATAGGARP